MALVLVYGNEGVAWLSRTQLLESWTCIKLVVMHGHHPFASIMARHDCAPAVSQGDTELTFYSVIAWQLNPMAYCAYMGAGLFLSKPRQAACDGLGSIRARCV